jgi:putative hydroxymethylpyrimidine transport system permease protein
MALRNGRGLNQASPSRSEKIERLRAVDHVALLPWQSILTGLAVLALWEVAVRALAVPEFLLPPPSRIVATLVLRKNVIAPEAAVTFLEMLGGFALGSMSGMAAAFVMARYRLVERAIGPLLVAAQALPVFAIAPILVVWFGFGYGSKVVMAALIIFFPVATSFFEGLRRTDESLVDLARLHGASAKKILFIIRLPAALPALAAGLRIAAAVAPLGAIVGEWVGSSAGLGLLMLHANARMQTDMVFAALTVLAGFSILLWAAIGAAVRHLIHWEPDTLAASAIRLAPATSE